MAKKGKASTKKKTAVRKAVKKTLKKSSKKNPAKKITKTKPTKKVMARVTKKLATQKTSKKNVPVAKAKSSPSPLKNFQALVTPLDDRVLVRVAANENRSPGGLWIPDSASSAGNKVGEIVSVGPGHRDKRGRRKPMDLKLGDRILFATYSGSQLDIQGQELLILRESEVLGVVEN